MNRINSLFNKLKKNREGALICYLPVIANDPTYSVEIADVFVKSGVDLVELSIPSDMPWLDGRTVQVAHLKSMANRATVDTAFVLSGLLRFRYPEWPIIPMSDYSGILGYGMDRFINNCAQNDIDAVEIPDYPVFAARDPHDFRLKLIKNDIQFVSFCYSLSYTSEESEEYQLLCRMVRETNSFMFLVTTPGVTGKRKTLAEDYLKYAINNIRQIQVKENNEFPVVVGFGISTPEQIMKVINETDADGVVVGSAILELILKNAGKEELAVFIHSLKKATRRS